MSADQASPPLPRPPLPQPDLPQPDLPQPDLPQPDLTRPDPRRHRARWKRGSPFEEYEPQHNQPLLIEPDDDRWEWRRRIRTDPRKLAIYRVGVAVAGVFFILLGAITGPLPGPGGIPLVLLGLAVWSSEFAWAHRLMSYFKHLLHILGRWPRRQKVLVTVLLICVGLLAVYTVLTVFGVPGWVPDPVADRLELLPGV